MSLNLLKLLLTRFVHKLLYLMKCRISLIMSFDITFGSLIGLYLKCCQYNFVLGIIQFV